jgi:hypothetical protein
LQFYWEALLIGFFSHPATRHPLILVTEIQMPRRLPVQTN